MTTIDTPATSKDATVQATRWAIFDATKQEEGVGADFLDLDMDSSKKKDSDEVRGCWGCLERV